MTQTNQHFNIAIERTGSFALTRSPWRTQCCPFAPHNPHFRYPAVTGDPIARVAPCGAR